METTINENSFLKKKNYKKNKFKNIKYEKRKINKIKFQLDILIIFLLIIVSISLYLNFNKRNEEEIKIENINKRREAITNKLIRNKEKRKTIKNKERKEYSIDKDLNEEYSDIQEYIYMATNGTFYNPNEVFKKSENPKISIVVTVYNGEGYLRSALLSIQNQDFKDVEIIMVDDCSKDNSVHLIKELMIKDPRIILYQNEENRGALYTKTRGVRHAKGKYVMILDVDDIYAQRDAFSTLYLEAEKNNLDILGFSLINSKIHIKRNHHIYNYIKTDIIHKSNIPKRMYICNSHKCQRTGGLTSCYFYRTHLFVDIIKQIDDKYLNVKMNFHEDFLLFFLLTRKANNLRQIKRIFYIVVRWPDKQNTKIQFRLNEKIKNKENLKCIGYINYIEFMLMKTNNDIIDKKIPSFELKKHFLKDKCKYNQNIRERAIKILELFLRNDYIEKEIKNEILVFLN